MDVRCHASRRRGLFPKQDSKGAALREALPAAKHTNALRLVNAESDGLPGLVVDRYADVLVVQFLAAGVERWRDAILDLLTEISGCEAIFERSDAEVRKLEGLEPRVGFARGNRNASRCPIIEHGLNFRVDVEQGQKTGFFLDQRENRQRVRALAAGREVLDGFSYTGGFAIAALAGGARRVQRDRILQGCDSGGEGESGGQSARRRRSSSSFRATFSRTSGR